ncbi:DgyrCDS5620 [Dimorphilus gyrociliatus]|uniref:DgyrCDS5620 n=1 Tax=Dimorphilus gyrociliatus TaxID=2664684 RepID=A0A7I8VM26_9ANNE|nr:DgyrCDS5620 [Dimorphilus gyrociliatus]
MFDGVEIDDSLKEVEFKAFVTSDPLKKYTVNNSVRLTRVQEELILETLKQPSKNMLGCPEELQLLANLCTAIQAKKTLDIGVFTGYSALTIASALPEDGKVIALDVSEEYTKIGRRFWKAAGVDHKIDLRLAPALETLEKLIENGGRETFDFAFIDADKLNYLNYYNLCLQLVRQNGVIAIDNTLWNGMVIKAENGEINEDSQTETERLCYFMNNFNKFLKSDNRINISLLNIGDGTTLCFKK